MRYDRAAVRWVALLLDKDRTLNLADLRELTDLLVGLGRHDEVAQLRLQRWLRTSGNAFEDRMGHRARATPGRSA